MPLVADLVEAVQRVQGRPERVRRFRDLPPESGAPGAARALVHQACVDWEIPIETENAAAVVVSELATNAVVHAETPLRAGVELSGEGEQRRQCPRKRASESRREARRRGFQRTAM